MGDARRFGSGDNDSVTSTVFRRIGKRKGGGAIGLAFPAMLVSADSAPVSGPTSAELTIRTGVEGMVPALSIPLYVRTMPYDCCFEGTSLNTFKPLVVRTNCGVGGAVPLDTLDVRTNKGGCCLEDPSPKPFAESLVVRANGSGCVPPLVVRASSSGCAAPLVVRAKDSGSVAPLVVRARDGDSAALLSVHASGSDCPAPLVVRASSSDCAAPLLVRASNIGWPKGVSSTRAPSPSVLHVNGGKRTLSVGCTCACLPGLPLTAHQATSASLDARSISVCTASFCIEHS